MAGDANPNANGLTPSYGEMALLLTPAPRRAGQTVGTTYTQAEDFAPFVLVKRDELASEATRLSFYDEVTATMCRRPSEST